MSEKGATKSQRRFDLQKTYADPADSVPLALPPTVFRLHTVR